MTDSGFAQSRMTGQDRRRIASRRLAGTSTCVASVRRPAFALTGPRKHADPDSIV
jgi:hypothetical protein